MEYQSQKSKCNICNKEFTQRGITKHIKSCINKQLVNECGIDNLYIVVQDPFNPDYFFHLLISQTASFQDLDKFLRKKWLECCGHLSAFRCEKVHDCGEDLYFLPVVNSPRAGVCAYTGE